MHFEQLLHEANTENELSINGSWGQGRTLFGGLTAALAYEKISNKVDSNRPLRSLSVNFSGQALADVPFIISEQLLSDGKSISQINGQVIQNDRIVTQVCACFGIERASTIEIPSPKESLPEIGNNQRLNYIKGLTPEFVQHFEFEYCKGQFPFSNSPFNELAGWVRFKDDDTPLTEARLIALIDAWPPTILQKLKSLAPCATVSWNLELLQPISSLDQSTSNNKWLYYDAVIKQAHHGYAHTEAKIYAQDGTLLALSRQLIAVYA